MLTLRTTINEIDGVQYVDTTMTVDNLPNKALVARSVSVPGQDHKFIVVEQLRGLAQHIKTRGLTSDIS